MLTMALEFIVIHSSAFMGVAALGETPRSRRALIVLGLAAFCSLFVGAFALVFRQWWIVWAVWTLTLNRLSGVIVGTASGDDKNALQSVGWAVSVVLYVVGAFATILLPLPRLGITPEVVQSAGLKGEGLWIDEPHRMLAFGVMYFLGQAAIVLVEPRGEA